MPAESRPRSQRNKEDRQRRIRHNGLEAERARSRQTSNASYIPTSQLSDSKRKERREKQKVYMQDRRRKEREAKKDQVCY